MIKKFFAVLLTISMALVSVAPVAIAAPQTVTVSNSSKTSDAKTYKDGTYQVGKDIPAGTYYIEATSQYGGYFAVTKDKSGATKSIIENDTFATHTFIKVTSGQYVTLTRAKMVAAKNAPEFKTDKNGYYDEGSYRVGTDIPAGKYKLVPTSKTESGHYATRSKINHSSDTILETDTFAQSITITVEDGQFLKFFGCKAKAE